MTLDNVIDGLQIPIDIVKVTFNGTPGRYFSMFQSAGLPTAGITPSIGLSGEACYNGLTGSLSFTNSVSNTYLARFDVTPNFTSYGTYCLADRLWHNSGISVTSTSTQSINSVTFAARDINESSDGEGVLIAMEVTSQMGAGTPSMSMTYLNSQGVTNSITTGILNSGVAVGTMIPIELAAGDTGVRKVIDWKQSASMTSGAYSLIAYRTISHIETVPIGGIPSFNDAIQLGLPRLYNDSCLFLTTKPTGSFGGAGGFNARIIYTVI